MAIGALALYCLWAGLLILQNPGLQYDEALLVLGSVHMRNTPLELTLPHDPDTWICPSHRCFPLMTARYVGAIKEYLCYPLFAIFGAQAEVLRILSVLLSALGIWGIAKLIREQVSPLAGAVTACVIAMNPAYVDLTTFDNGTVAIWMAALGLLCAAISSYVRRRNAAAAFWLGAAMGLGVWARANFLWLLIGLAGAAVLVLRTRILQPVSDWAAFLLGGAVGGFPFLLYQVISRGGTWEAMSIFTIHDSLSQRLSTRLIMFSETLISDREHRAMWNGPAMPGWERWLFLIVVIAACLVCLRSRSIWERGFALCFLFLGAFLFFSTIIVAEHHLIVLVPLAAAITVFGSFTLARYAWGRQIVACLAIVYLGVAGYWQIAAIRGLSRTGGVGQWSDAVFALADYLQEKYSTQEIKILDWGLQNNLYILSDGKIRSREIYGFASKEWSGTGRPWVEEIRNGGVFLMNGPSNRQFPTASLAFLEALRAAHPSVRRFTVNQLSGDPYAEIVEVDAAR
jgi:Dolichyl-phosphate-mannose-protein mannosyltransferase